MDTSTVKESNNLISSLARRKQLKQAKKVFSSIKDVANNHSFCAILNAHVECGDIVGAKNIFDEILNHKSMEKKGDSKVRPDVINCTTMMKGYVSIFDLQSALDVFSNMNKFQPKVIPNIRTLNTLMRGCVFTGDVKNATDLFLKAKGFGIELDSTFYEMYISLLCRSLQLEKVFPMIGRVKDQFQSSSMIISYQLGLALFVKGDFKKMMKVILKASSESENELAATSTSNMKTSTDHDITDTVAVTVGGKRSWSNAVDESRQESLAVYLNHKNRELEREISNLKKFQFKDCHRKHLCELLKKLLLFPYNHDTPLSSSSSSLSQILINSLTKTITENYGLQILKSEYLKEDLDIENLYTNLFQTCHSDLSQKHSYINFKSFSRTTIPSIPSVTATSKNQNHTSNKHSTNQSQLQQQIKVEICSGNGDWICQQAKADKGSLWLSIEIRADRVYKTFINALLEHIDNLVVVQGCALFTTSNHFQPNSVDNFMINMPEPPQQRGKFEEAKHLLTSEFFISLSRVLKKTVGLLTVYTDNKWYGELLVHLLSESIGNTKQLKMKSIVPSEIEKRFSSGSGVWNVEFQMNNVYLFSGRPSSECGYYDHTSGSYFDRLKKDENQGVDHKYFIVLRNI